MNLLCRQEFAELVPAKIETVLLPPGDRAVTVSVLDPEPIMVARRLDG